MRRRPVSAGINGQPFYTLANFSQPTTADVAGFGITGRNFFRRPGVWNVDMSLFKGFQIGRWRPEFRLEMANVFNHTTWGRPVVTFTANNFMQFVPQSTVRHRRQQPAEHPWSAPHPDRASHVVLRSPPPQTGPPRFMSRRPGQ